MTVSNHNYQSDNDIAIVGMACRYPGNITSPSQLIQFLFNRGNGITEVPGDRWDIDAYYDADKNKPNRMYVKRGGFLSGIDLFDPLFFGISPKEAPHIDPQHRWLLEIAQEAFENAGIKQSDLKGSDTAVYIGQFMHDYEQLLLDANAHKNITSHSATGPSMTLTANRISYHFDLTGASVTLDTACSSSLVALDFACKAILSGESRMAIAGGVNILLRPELTMSICAASMLSPDGYCKSFDASANGYVRSEGAGLVLVKRLRDALADGDPVHAVIKGTGVNQDGQTLGITVPNGESQKKLLQSVFKKAGVLPEKIQYAEAHGTGTAVGDPIEVNALGSVLGERSADIPACIIGSIKSNLGHMEAAAGVAGLMKTVLSLNAKKVPRNLHFNEINPAINLQNLNLDVASEERDWPTTNGEPRRALVNSFGFGGTNANVILEEAPCANPDLKYRKKGMNTPYNFLALSGKTEQALKDSIDNYIGFFQEINTENEQYLQDVCYTSTLRRDHYRYRLVVAAESYKDFERSLEDHKAGKVSANVWSGSELQNTGNKICFVFSGMGTQWAEVGKELYDSEPVYQAALDACDLALASLSGWSLLDALFNTQDPSAIHSTNIAQPAIFATQFALASLLKSWGVSPDIIVGHSAGEVAASCVAGVLSFEDAIQVIYHRSRLQHTTEGLGKMLAVGLGEQELEPILNKYRGKVSIGAINSDDAITLAGEADALEAIAEQLDKEGAFARFLKVGVPYHSPVMDRLKEPLVAALSDIKPRKPEVKLFSTVSGKETQEGDWTPEYWFKNVREPVQFKKAIDNIAKRGVGAFVEISPHSALLSSIKKNLAAKKNQPAFISTLKREQHAMICMLEALANFHLSGIHSPWQAFYPEGGTVVPLPNYPWQRAAYWCEAEEVYQARIKNTGFLGAFEKATHPLLGGKLGSSQALWQHSLDLAENAYIVDHKVGEDIVFPGAAYVEIALAIGAELQAKEGQSKVLSLTDLKFHKALYLEQEGVRTLESVLNPVSREFSISANEVDGSTWSRFASGYLGYRDGLANRSALDLAAIKSTLTKAVSKSDFYEHCRNLGLNYAGGFKGLQELHVDGGVVLAEIELDEAAASLPASYLLNPMILDAAFQTFFATVEIGYLPVGIDELRYYSKPGNKACCYFQTLEINESRGLGNITICDEDGNIQVEILGIEVHAIQRKESNDKSSKKLLYNFSWEELARSPHSEGTELTGEWIIVADKNNYWKTLYSELSKNHHKVFVIENGEAFSKCSENHYVSPFASQDYLTQLLSLRENDSRGVIYLPALDMPEVQGMNSDVLMKHAEYLGFAALQFSQAMAKVEWKNPQKLVVVTQQAQAVGEHEVADLNILQSSLWGFARVLASEHPEFAVCLIDLSNMLQNSEVAEELCLELSEKNYEQEVAIRNSKRYVNRLSVLDGAKLKRVTNCERTFAENEFFKLDTSSSDGKARVVPLCLREPDKDEVVLKSLYSHSLPASAAFDDSHLANHAVIASVIACPHANEGVNVGDTVLVFIGGDLQSHFCVNKSRLLPLPISPDYGKIAGLAFYYFLASHLFEEYMQEQALRSVLIHNAATPFGLILSRLAVKNNLNLYALVNSEKEAQVLHADDLLVNGLRKVIVCDGNASFRRVEPHIPHSGIDLVLGDWLGDLPSCCVDVVADAGKVVHVNPEYSVAGTSAVSRTFKNYSWHQVSIHTSLANLNSDNLHALAKVIDAGLDIDNLVVAPFHFSSRSISKLENPIQDVFEAEVVDYSYFPVSGYLGKCEHYVKPNKSYLVTGGLGGLGLEIMQWLAEKGATSIVLIGRSKPRTEALETIRAVRDKGVVVEVRQADVSSYSDVVSIINEFSSSLAGIIHSAGVLDDGVIAQQTPEKYSKVLAPKVKGAWNLHCASEHLDLDMFICFSSIASIVGWAGQSNYASANAFLDGLAVYRKRKGLAALTVNWGPWADAGMAANLDERDQQRMKESGMFPISREQGLTSMATLLEHRIEQAGVFEIDWRLIGKQLPDPEKKTLLRDLLVLDERNSEKDFLDDLLGATSDIRESMLVNKISHLLASVLGLGAGDVVDIDANIFDYGVNSLMALELKNNIQSTLKLKLPASLFAKQLSMRDIVEFILESDLLSSGVAAKQEKLKRVEHVGELGFTADQKNFLSWLHIHPQWTILNNYFVAKEEYNLDKLNQAINAVIREHDCLRARFSKLNGVWQQNLVPHEDYDSITSLDWRHINEQDQVLAELKTLCEQRALAHDLERDPLIKVLSVKFGSKGENILLFSFHHFSMDGYSITVLLSDIKLAYSQLMEDKPVELPGATMTVKAWLDELARHAKSEKVSNEILFWKSKPLSEASETPMDFPQNLHNKSIGTHQRYRTILDAHYTDKMAAITPTKNGVAVFDLVLTAFAILLAEWKGSPNIVLGAIDNGRGLVSGDHIDLSRTIGWLSIIKTIFLRAPEVSDLKSAAKDIGEQYRLLPNGGANLEVLSAYHEDELLRQEMLSLPRPKVWINFSGNPLRNDDLGVNELEGYSWIHPDNQAPWYLLISINRVNEIFNISWDYSSAIFSEETISHLADNYNNLIKKIIDAVTDELVETSIEKAEKAEEVN